MKAFMDKDFLLETETAKHLYHTYAKHMPLADYHCHLNPQEIKSPSSASVSGDGGGRGRPAALHPVRQ